MTRVIPLAEVAALRRIVHDFEEAGWRVQRPSLGHDTGGPAIYILDVESGRQFVVVTRAGSIDGDSATLGEKGFTHTSAVDGLVGILKQLVSGQAAFDEVHRGVLYLASEAYVAGTRSYKAARDQGLIGNCAFLVLCYQDHSNDSKLLRPVVIPNNRVLSPQMVQLAAGQALAFDRRMHPERFARAKVLPLRVLPAETV